MVDGFFGMLINGLDVNGQGVSVRQKHFLLFLDSYIGVKGYKALLSWKKPEVRNMDSGFHITMFETTPSRV